jgi:hypothetical protein
MVDTGDISTLHRRKTPGQWFAIITPALRTEPDIQWALRKSVFQHGSFYRDYVAPVPFGPNSFQSQPNFTFCYYLLQLGYWNPETNPVPKQCARGEGVR